MDQKVRLISRDSDVIDNTKIIQEWMVIENNRMRDENALRTAREKGLKQGIEQGKEKNNIIVIKNMLNKGLDYEIISEVTSKTIEEIKKIEIDM